MEDIMENPTWVPQARNAWYHIPQPIRWLALASALAAMFMYAPLKTPFGGCAVFEVRQATRLRQTRLTIRIS